MGHSFPEVNPSTLHKFAILLAKFVSTFHLDVFCGPIGNRNFKVILNLVPMWPQPQIISVEKNLSLKLLCDIEFGSKFWWHVRTL